MPTLTFLSAEKPLTKAYTLDPATKEITTKSFQNQKLLTSHIEHVEDIEGMHRAILEHAKKGHALLKGSLKTQLKNESRAGKTANSIQTQWLMLDIDGIPDVNEIDDLFGDIPEISNVSYIKQYSASYKIKSDDLNVHLFFMLDKPIHPRKLKSYLKALNLRPGIKAKLHLTEAKASLKYLIDPSVADESRIIYIAPPVSNAKTVNEIFKNPDDRIQLVKKDKDTLTIPDFDPAVVENELNTKLNELRATLGLKKKTTVEQHYDRNNEVYLFDKKPDAIKIYYAYVNPNSGFVYCNINNGDSKAYYFPFGRLTQQTIMRNFKSEPFFEIYKADPDFYNEWNKILLPQLLKENPELKKSLSDEDPNQDLVGLPADENHFVAFDAEESVYKVVHFNETNDRLSITRHDLEKLKNYCEATGIEFPEIRPIYRFITDITSGNRNPIDHNTRTVNSWVLPALLDPNTNSIAAHLEHTPPKSLQPMDVVHLVEQKTPFIWSHINSLFCSNRDEIARFLNWYALAVFDRVKLRTSWILQGTQGTSKSFITQNLTRRIYNDNPNLVPNKSLDVLNDNFNDWLEEAVFIEWEEASAGKTINDLQTIDKIKMMITGQTLNVRAMWSGHKQTQVNFNMVFTTNHNAPFKLTDDDRRFNVAPRQTVKWQHQLDEETFDYYDKNFDTLLDNELPTFCALMMAIDTDITEANTVKMTPAKLALVEATKTVNELILNSLATGDIAVVHEALSEAPTHNNQMMILKTNAENVIKDICTHIYNKKTATVITWPELSELITVLNNDNKIMAGGKIKKMAFNMGYGEERKRRTGGRKVHPKKGLLVPINKISLAYAKKVVIGE